MTKRISLTDLAHQFIQNNLKAGDIAIDATVGNGYDTQFLINLVQKQGIVFGFDIQQQAIESTKTKLTIDLDLNNLTLFNTSHKNISESIPKEHHGKIKAIMFNLGYLPGSDKTIITQASSTLDALNQAENILMLGGVISIMAYPGHPGGEEEAHQVGQWCNQLNPNEFIVEQIPSSDKETAPILFTIIKRASKNVTYQ